VAFAAVGSFRDKANKEKDHWITPKIPADEEGKYNKNCREEGRLQSELVGHVV
jgi:hypothetical protein